MALARTDYGTRNTDRSTYEEDTYNSALAAARSAALANKGSAALNTVGDPASAFLANLQSKSPEANPDPVANPDYIDPNENPNSANYGNVYGGAQTTAGTPARGTQNGANTDRGDQAAAVEDGSPRANDPGHTAPGVTDGIVRTDRSSSLNNSAAQQAQQAAKDKNMAASGADVDALLAKRKDYTTPQELKDVYAQIQSQINGDQDAYLKARQDVSLRKESQGLSNVYRNATSGADAQIGAGQVVQQYGLDSNEDLASDLAQKQQLRGQELQGAQALADEHNNEYIYNQQFPLEQRLEFLKQKKQNQANIQIANIAGDAAQTSGILGFIGNLASAAIAA